MIIVVFMLNFYILHNILYLLDEVIRQASVINVERGILLIRIREEFKSNMEAYNQLVEDSLMYGMRKTIIVSFLIFYILLYYRLYRK